MGHAERSTSSAISSHTAQHGRELKKDEGKLRTEKELGLKQDARQDDPDVGVDNGNGTKQDHLKKITDPPRDMTQNQGDSSGRDIKQDKYTKDESCNDCSDSEYEDAPSHFKTEVELEEGELDTSDEQEYNDNNSSSNNIPIKRSPPTLPTTDKSIKSTPSHLRTMKSHTLPRRQYKSPYLVRPHMRRPPALQYVEMRPSPTHTYTYLRYNPFHPPRPPYYPPLIQNHPRYQPFPSTYQQRQQQYFQFVQSTAPRPINRHSYKRN